MSLIIPANTLASGGFAVDNSCRFNSTSSDKLTRTFGSGGSVVKWTYSTWFKISYIGGNEQVFFSSFDNGDNYSYIKINGNNKLEFRAEASGSDVLRYTLTRRFRDPSAFMHLVVALDSSLGTAGDRIKIWINGVRETVFDASTAPSQDATTLINSAAAHEIGHAGDGSDFFNGYMSQVGFINNAQYDADQFGEFDEDSGIWKPIDISGLTFGQTSFFLDFADSADLGDDESGNSNDWTEVNLAAIDQSTDTCTNNFATMNPLDAYWSASTFEDGNCTIIMPETTNETYTRATMGVSSGKWYWEALCTVQNSTMNAGIVDSPALATNTELGKRPKGLSWNDSGTLNGNDAQVFNSTQAPAYSTSQIISFAMDLDNNFLYLRLAGSYTNSGNPESGASGTGGAAIPTNPSSGFYFPAFGDSSTSGGRYQVNFGNSPFAISSGNTDGNGYGNFEYAVPSGYLALCTANLSEVLS